MRESNGAAAPRCANGRLVANVVHFARALRGAGFALGPGKVLDALDALGAVGITRREDFYWTLHAVFVSRPAEHALFDQAFHVFWRNPRLLERMMSMLLPTLRRPEAQPSQVLSRRLAEALFAEPRSSSRPSPREPEVEVDARLSASAREAIRQRDFEQMSGEELTRAKQAVAALALPSLVVRTRRFESGARGPAIDVRGSLRAALRQGPDAMPLLRRRPREALAPLVMLCDISGSMARYARMMLHFAHALGNRSRRVHSFVFATRLTNITRELREKDPDRALAEVGRVVQDWDGGTRIAHCLREFNLRWSRRVLGQGASVLLVSDGLESDAGAALGREMERLHKSCRALIWLNPLLRYDGFEPRARGIRAMLPHVDALRSAHNLASLEALVAALNAPPAQAKEEHEAWVRKLR